MSGMTDQLYLDEKARIEREKEDALKRQNAALVSGYSANQLSPEMERANILYEKTKKYMPTMMKQAGLSGLGVAQSAVLQAQNDHMNRMNALRYERGQKASAAASASFDDWQNYIKGLDAENQALDLRKAQADIQSVYEGDGDAASKDFAFGEVLGRYADNPEIQGQLIEYAKGFQANSKAVDKLLGFYTPGTDAQAEEGMTVEQYKDYWDRVKQDRIFDWYKTLGASEQDAVDAALERYGVASVEDMALEAEAKEKEAAKIDEKINIKLKVLGENWKSEDIQAILKAEEFKNMSSGMKEYLETLLYEEQAVKDAYGVPSEEDLAVINTAFSQLIDPQTNAISGAATSAQLVGFLTKYPNAPTDQLDAVRSALAGLLYGGDQTPEQMKAMSDVQADDYIKALRSVELEPGKPNTNLVSEEFYKSYVKPEIDEFKSVLGAYRAEAERISNETYQKQMAGEKPIEGSDGKKWYIAKSPEGDVEAFMKENEGAVNKALGEYGNVHNPSIPDKMVIKVGGKRLVFDKKSETWHYVTAYQGVVIGGTVDTATVKARVGNDYGRGVKKFTGEASKAVISDFKPSADKRVIDKNEIKALNGLDLSDIKNGEVRYVSKGRQNKAVVYYNGTWYYRFHKNDQANRPGY